MSDADEPTPIDQREPTRSLVPFIAAAVVALLLVGGVVLLGVLRPAENNVTDSDRVAVAVRNFATAQADSDAKRRATTACPEFDAVRSPLGPDALGKQVEIENIRDTTVDGGRARATVTSKIDGRERTATWNLTKSDERWLVCN
ncbi:hypothetical protein NDR87_28045 [Nocardia sp. CDC159]|uniref:Uncharacterized protein n=1 Tax=Nocardia pulmonis TaxID=2951408 RepID=A0A9X2EDC2_9NOCA|nr:MULTISPECIES: hypothetical protein [Nocardia]MCM6777345.1 hypothetical protein [Nocardia pulmonis]MCM6790230.1 hypothetical protein [Nocardia sp. CDC159]